MPPKDAHALGLRHNNLAEHDEGYDWARKAAEATPSMYMFAYFVINAVRYGRLAEARDTVAKMLKLRPDMTVLMRPNSATRAIRYLPE